LVLWSEVASLRRRWRFLVPQRRVLFHSFSSTTRSLGACRCQHRYRWCSARSCYGRGQSPYHLYYISSATSMEGIDEDHTMGSCDHGPMVVGRNAPRVSFLIFISSFPAYPTVLLVPPFVGSRTKRSRRPEGYSTSLDPPHVFV
jgi:hypothetical protein